jgi:hypothetical protein
MTEFSNFEIMDIIKDMKLDHYFGGIHSKTNDEKNY